MTWNNVWRGWFEGEISARDSTKVIRKYEWGLGFVVGDLMGKSRKWQYYVSKISLQM
jgi:hypothetical protein